ncbi:MAG: outer membrane beta-barrel protein [Proteiniphilum sp.]|nr:outer membrane beta-barrel protein [Proteiniphilum sp.]
MMNDHWQDNLRNRMEHHEEPAPEGLWEGIDQLLTDRSIVREMPMKPKRFVQGVFIGALSAVAAIAILLLLVLRYTSSDNQEDVRFTEKNAPVVTQKEQPIVETMETANDIKSPSSTKSKSTMNPQPLYGEAKTTVAATPQEGLTAMHTVKEDTGESEATDQVSEADKTNNDLSAKEAALPESDVRQANDQLFASATQKPARNPSKWQTNLSMSNLPAGSSETYSGYGTFALAETVEEQYLFPANYTREQEQVYTHVKHHQPIIIGLTLRYNFNDRWNMSSGLTYSLLTSELYSGNGNYYYDDLQTLHYIGIPVSVAYTFWQNNKLSTYVSTGGLVEMNVAGSLTSNYYLDNQLEVTTKEKVRSKALQWSVNAAMGLGYQISNNIELYAEPGISYYFRNNSELETIYKENPLHFNLQLGLRFTFND